MPQKDPDEVKDYEFDFTAELGTGEEISGTPTIEVAPTGELTVDSSTNGTATVTVWLSAGVAGTEYVVTCHITTNNTPARKYDKSMVIPVLDD